MDARAKSLQALSDTCILHNTHPTRRGTAMSNRTGATFQKIVTFFLRELLIVTSVYVN
jgi:hypothetical protein